jgi:hypothetical protein
LLVLLQLLLLLLLISGGCCGCCGGGGCGSRSKTNAFVCVRSCLSQSCARLSAATTASAAL